MNVLFCPSCGQVLDVSSALSEQVVQCPFCLCTFQVPTILPHTVQRRDYRKKNSHRLFNAYLFLTCVTIILGSLVCAGSFSRGRFKEITPYRIVSVEGHASRKFIRVIVPKNWKHAQLVVWDQEIRNKHLHSNEKAMINYYDGQIGADFLVLNSLEDGQLYWIK